VFAADGLAFLSKKVHAPFDVVFADPPYGQNLLRPALERLLAGGWLVRDGLAVAEVEAGLDMDRELGFSGLSCLTSRLFGQTRIVIWQAQTDAWPSTPGPSLP
jgi:16S rRNA (guanine966-N2)-methyltransferase